MDRRGSANVLQQPWAATKYQLLLCLSLLQLAHQCSLRLHPKVKIDTRYNQNLLHFFAKYIYIFTHLTCFTKCCRHNVSSSMVHVLNIYSFMLLSRRVWRNIQLGSDLSVFQRKTLPSSSGYTFIRQEHITIKLSNIYSGLNLVINFILFVNINIRH
jgi:hypothetical protein